ncbi:MAG: ArsR/SmtB family transcription factor [Candidatus Limnocylindrales bacterium]
MNRPTDQDALLLQALADPMRLAIVRQLSTERETCACDLIVGIDISQPTVSHHLRVLREAGLVTADRRGSWIYYALAPDGIARLQRIVAGLLPANGLGAAAIAGRRLPVIDPSPALTSR